MPELDPTGVPVQVGPVLLRTPGLDGYADVHAAATQDMRAAELATPAFEAALAATGTEPQLTIAIRGGTEVPVAAVETRSTAYDEPAIEVEVPDAGPEYGQMLLYQDEAGVMTWNFPVDERNELDVTRGAATRRYVIRRHVPPTPEAGSERSILGAVGTKLLKVLAFKLLDPVAGLVGPHFVHSWEQKKRPYRLRGFTPENYNIDSDAPVIWKDVNGRPALLMIHGTFSRAHAAFGAMSRDTIESLAHRYDGRVFAFDHFTMSEDPRQNIDRMIAMLPADADLHLDIVCHSRGGLVARQLAEQQAALSLGGRRIRVNRIVFVATPNAGTLLADTKHMSDFIDSYTNLLNFVPDNGITETLEAIITVVKQLAVGTVKGLDGLQAMHPSGAFLKALNGGQKDGKEYFAISSNYEPIDAGWKSWAKDRLLDRIFGGSHNDLVVPTQGVYAANGSGFFPIEQRVDLTDRDGIAHTGFFGQARVEQQLLSWLQPSGN